MMAPCNFLDFRLVNENDTTSEEKNKRSRKYIHKKYLSKYVCKCVNSKVRDVPIYIKIYYIIYPYVM